MISDQMKVAAKCGGPSIGWLAKFLDYLPLVVSVPLDDLPSLIILARRLNVGWLFHGWLVLLLRHVRKGPLGHRLTWIGN
jgi:hypothetical protein